MVLFCALVHAFRIVEKEGEREMTEESERAHRDGCKERGGQTRTPYLLPVYEYRSAIMAMEMLTVRLTLL